MERWTNGLYPSTEHRVVSKSNNSRYSLVYFCMPNHESTIDPSEIKLSYDNYKAIQFGELVPII